jgi:undecaprenyl-diphosphatase
VTGNAPTLRDIRDPLLVRTLVLIALGIVAFLLLAALVTRGTTQDLDVRILREVRKFATREDHPGRLWGEESIIAITSLGATINLVCACLLTLGFLLLTRKWHTSLVLVLVLSGAGALNQSLKPYYDRARPDAVTHAQYVETKSFPSGHALLSTAVYGTLGAIGISLLQDRRLKIYLLGSTILLILLIGLSRIYLGVHYPSDVLAGWITGTVWSLACWLLARHFARADRRFGETSVPVSASAPMQTRPNGPKLSA